MRARLWITVELAALAALIAAAWWLGGVATDAWLARVAALGVRAPEPETIRGLALRAELQFTLGVVALGAARWYSTRRRDPLAVPWLLPAAVAACLFGLVVHGATVEVAAGAAREPTAAAFAQGFLAGCVAAAAILVAPVDFAELAARAQVPIAIAIVAIFGALAVAGSGPAGSNTRINLGPVQPIELVKPLAIAFLAAFLGARAPKLRWQRRTLLGLRWPRVELLVPATLVLVLIFGGLYAIGDLGPVLLLAFVFLGMFYLVSRATGWAVIALAVVALLVAVLAIWPALAGGGTVETRLRMWSDPWTNALSNGHQLGEGLWATAAGGARGQGLANAATPLVPAGKTDLVLATMTEQLGARGLVAYQMILAAIIFGALYVAARSRTPQRVLIAGGIGILVLVQWAVIQAGTLGYLPLTGIVVPFLSSGRSSMVVFVAVIGVVARLSVDARARERSAELDELHAGVRGFAIAAAIVVAAAIATGIGAAVIGRHETSARTIVARLGDGTIAHRKNPRLAAIAAQIRRGTIADRSGAPLATSDGGDGRGRSYPLGDAMGTLLGVHPTSVLLPAWALERTLEPRLRGYPEVGAFAPLLYLDPAARAARIRAIDADLAPRSVRLTIDARLQTEAGKLLAAAAARGKRLAIAAVVMDVDTGHVLARVQVPDYDPNRPDWQARVRDGDGEYLRRFRGAYGEWPDKTGVHGMFQSGSIGKLFTALAAVRARQDGARFSCVDADAQGPLFTRPGWPKAIHDHFRDRPHGDVDLVEAIAVSCNVYFGQLGLALGAEPLVALRRAGASIGFTGEFVPGAAGSRQLASTAFGQGAMVANTMQAARLVAAIAAGGRYRSCPPTMLLEAPCPEAVLIDDPAALAPVIAGMRRVMTGGTGAGLRPPAGLRVYGKTGTADVRGFAGEEPFGIARAQTAAPHSWFVAFAESESASAATGRIAVAVVVPRGGTGASAAGPIAMDLLAAAKRLGYLP